MNELAGQVRAALDERGPIRQAEGRDRMGLFSVPFRPATGPLQGHMIRAYRSGRDPEVLEPLVRRHANYLDYLERVGLGTPETELLLLHEHGVLKPVTVQKAVPQSALLPELVATSETAAALRALERVAVSIRAFWTGVAQRPERIGLHASIHNFAIPEAGPVMFLDTFPPLIGYSREEMGRVLLRFSESGLIRGIGTLLPGRVREIQDPWYSLAGNLGLLVEGAIRLRPKDRAALVGWAETFAEETLSQADAEALLKSLSRPRPSVLPSRAARRFGAGLRPNA